ncbi:hypothetical protein C3F34_11130 [Acinetobacter sp. ACNIH2]|jgi:hypothetical protein|uniref:hypothetical protein n=2 Tax=Moraxellaceae TaxID=468 RepID=UPI0005CC9628|nr:MULTISPECIES: hypothetical protein [unclassified Acinetobacter]AUX86543.1 hypothetical protein C3F34_11130 [Acinetobacter sp. ACNIH2]UOG18315.1 hypothetical protein MP622_01380 [Acinetobacter sp. PK01]
MKSQFSRKLAFIAEKEMAFKLLLISLLLLQSAFTFAEEVKAVWYRYYDNKGVANISTSVTPNHIRYGYEALDRNMQVIKRNRPYNAETEQKKAPQRAAQAKQREADLRLKRAYTNSKVAINKGNEALANIKKQISFQQDQLKQLQNDRILFKRQEMEYLRKGDPVPAILKSNLSNNATNISNKKEQIQSLQTNYRNTQAEYANIIARLKAMEN